MTDHDKRRMDTAFIRQIENSLKNFDKTDPCSDGDSFGDNANYVDGESYIITLWAGLSPLGSMYFGANNLWWILN